MILKDGVTYRDRDGNDAKIMGDTRTRSSWCWSLQGNWYERATGKHVWWTLGKGHYVCEGESRLDLIEEVTEPS